MLNIRQNCRSIRLGKFVAFLAVLLLAGQFSVAGAQELQQQKNSNVTVLENITQQLQLGEVAKKALKKEIALLKQDRARITEALINTAKRSQALEEKLSAIEQKLEILTDQETDIKKSLYARRNLLSQVLAALQRMGRKPPPALLVRPEDALASVRSAVLLGAVVPELQSETSILIADLKELARLRAGIQTERKKYAVNITTLTEDNARLSLLVEEKQKLEGQSRNALKIQENKIRDLATRATSLKQLIASLNKQIAETERIAKLARVKTENQKRKTDERLATTRSRLQTGQPDKGNRLVRMKPALKFDEAKGQLQLPVRGVEVLSFGEKSTSGIMVKGAFMATRANALVIAPVDARIVYAGAFRSYGKLLILDVGNQVHIVMSGMSEIDVTTGQFVLAGEPIAKMGTRRIASVATVDVASSRPMLYVEFRKDGKSFDPAPWWAENSTKRSSNDS